MSARLFMVYDSRAQYDFDKAEVLQSYGMTKPSATKLKRDWGGIGAVLAWHTITKMGPDKPDQFGEPNTIRVIE